MTEDDVIERCLIGQFEGSYNNPIHTEWLDMDKKQIDKILEVMLVN